VLTDVSEPSQAYDSTLSCSRGSPSVWAYTRRNSCGSTSLATDYFQILKALLLPLSPSLRSWCSPSRVRSTRLPPALDRSAPRAPPLSEREEISLSPEGSTFMTSSIAFASREREQSILDHLPQVKLLATRIHRRCPPSVLLEDLESAGVTGLIEAADRYDRRRNVEFKTTSVVSSK
jgi:hypothetical protein